MAQKFEVGELVSFPIHRGRDVGEVLAWFPLDRDYLIKAKCGDAFFIKEEDLRLYER